MSSLKGTSLDHRLSAAANAKKTDLEKFRSYRSGEHMADVEWQPLPALWPPPAFWTDVGGLMLLVFHAGRGADMGGPP
jgi:hypothetical protein